MSTETRCSLALGRHSRPSGGISVAGQRSGRLSRDDFLRHQPALYSLSRDCAEYHDARAFFAALPTISGTVAICELFLVELYVLLRNPDVLKHSLDPADAVSIIQAFRQHPTWAPLDYPGDNSGVMDEVWRLAAQPNVGRRLVFDARLALALRHQGVTQFATRNEIHFAGFGFTRVWNPLANTPA